MTGTRACRRRSPNWAGCGSRDQEPPQVFLSDLTNTIRARGHRGLRQEARHTTIPDQTATDSVLNPGVLTSGRPHTPYVTSHTRHSPSRTLLACIGM